MYRPYPIAHSHSFAFSYVYLYLRTLDIRPGAVFWDWDSDWASPCGLYVLIAFFDKRDKRNFNSAVEDMFGITATTSTASISFILFDIKVF